MRFCGILVTATILVQPACNLRDAMSTDVEIVAQADAHELSVDELAEMVAQGNIPLTRAAVDQWTQLWIDYSLFAQRMAAGDSLLDTIAVATAMWSDVDSLLVVQLRVRLMDSLVRIDDTAIDSAFAAELHRFIDLIVVQVPMTVTPEEREQRRRATARLQARVAAGTSFERVIADLDPAAGAQGGRMLVTRAALPAILADTVFALTPGGLSGVVETQEAFYVVGRPRLDQVRDDFALALRDTVGRRAEVEYFAALPERWSITVRSRAPALVRQAARYPRHFAASPKVLGTYRDGAFAVADLVRWLPVLRVQDQIARATDEQLRELVQSLIQRETLFIEAQRRGFVLPLEEFQRLKDRLAEQIDEVQDALGLDVLLASPVTPDVLRRMVQLAVGRHVSEVLSGQRELAVVPPFLAEMLRSGGSWTVSYAAVDRTVERARTTRIQLARAGRVIRPPLPAPKRPSSEVPQNVR